MWRNASAELAKVADDVLRSEASLVHYKLLWCRLNILQCTPTWDLKLNKVNLVEDANKMAYGELEWLDKWRKL